MLCQTSTRRSSVNRLAGGGDGLTRPKEALGGKLDEQPGRPGLDRTSVLLLELQRRTRFVMTEIRACATLVGTSMPPEQFGHAVLGSALQRGPRKEGQAVH